MAKEVKQRQGETPADFYRLSEHAQRYGFRATIIDGTRIAVRPRNNFVRTTETGQHYPDITEPAQGLILSLDGQRIISATDDGFTGLTPKQVYELASNGTIILSRVRPEHGETFLNYIKENTGTPGVDEY
ncbi:MAG: hypothetical protein LC115_08205 [Bacteroidia bacterium]|nr:hypothetical protein [Chitinophagaceae bacterium]MCZ2356654.1 hypothetical protein [Bacteroidia bacterium]